MPNKIRVKIRKSVDETIRKVDGKYVVYPKRGGKRLGTHETEKDAKKQLAAIEISKAQNEDLDEGRGASPSYCKSTPCKDMGFTQKASCKSQGIKDCYKNEEMELEERCQKGYKTHPTRKTKVMFGRRYRNCVKAEEGKDPKKGTGKKPKGSGRRLYTDENPKDTVSVEFKSVAAIKRTLAKKSFKNKSHKRQSQIINLIHQRARAAYKNAKDPKVKARLKKAFEYAEQRKEASKKKTKARMKKKKNEDVRKMPNSDRYGVYADKFKDGKRVMTPGGKHAQELKKTYASKKDANDYMAAIMIAKGG